MGLLVALLIASLVPLIYLSYLAGTDLLLTLIGGLLIMTDALYSVAWFYPKIQKLKKLPKKEDAKNNPQHSITKTKNFSSEFTTSSFVALAAITISILALATLLLIVMSKSLALSADVSLDNALLVIAGIFGALATFLVYRATKHAALIQIKPILIAYFRPASALGFGILL